MTRHDKDTTSPLAYFIAVLGAVAVVYGLFNPDYLVPVFIVILAVCAVMNRASIKDFALKWYDQVFVLPSSEGKYHKPETPAE